MKRKVCKDCRMFVDGVVCPNCKGNQFTINWQGRLHVMDPEKSDIAKRLKITMAGEYALKAR